VVAVPAILRERIVLSQLSLQLVAVVALEVHQAMRVATAAAVAVAVA
jgi:hypothetical protein